MTTRATWIKAISAAPAMAFLCTACASTTGVLQLGKDTYTVSAGMSGTGSVSGNNTASKQHAFTEATKYCRKLGKQMLVKNDSLDASMAGSTTELVFRCLDETDPEFHSKPDYRKEPDVAIEHR